MLNLGKSERVQSLPNIHTNASKRKLYGSGYRYSNARSLGGLTTNPSTQSNLVKSGMERQFDMFCKFGGSDTQVEMNPEYLYL